MAIPSWVLTYSIDMGFWLWVLRWGGAEWLEGTFASGFLVSIFATSWSVNGIKLFAVGMIVISTIYFVLGLFYPDFRHFL